MISITKGDSLYKKGTWVRLKNGDFAHITGFEDHQYKILHYRYIDWLNIYNISCEYIYEHYILGLADVPTFHTGEFALFKNKVIKITETGCRHTIDCNGLSLCVEPFQLTKLNY